MEHYDSAQLDDLVARLAALEHKVDRLESRMAQFPAVEATDTHREFDPYLTPASRPRRHPASRPERQPVLQSSPPNPPPADPRLVGQTRQPQREGNVGAYLLSAAAGLLVVLAAVSLIALVWEQIPDAWKVGGLGLLSLAMVSAGTTLGENRPRQRVAAATITGTGGALGFVTIVGATGLMDLLVPLALVLMAAWGFLLLLVSWTTQQFFTAVVSAVGAVVIVGFACAQAVVHPARATQMWTLVGGYLIALAAVCALLPHYAPRMRLRAWLPTTSMVVTATALLIGPTNLLSNNSPAGMTLLCLPAVVLLVQAYHSGRLLSRSAGRHAVEWEWAGVGAALVLTMLRLGLDPAVPPASRSLIAVVFLIAAAASTAALLPDGGASPWPRSVIGVNLGVMTGVGAAASVVDPRLLLPAVLTLAPASLPLVRDGRSAPVAVPPLAGVAAFTLAISAEPPPATVVLAVAAVVIAVGMSVLLETRLAPAPAQPVRPPRSTRAEALTTATWLIAADLVLVLPALVERLAPGATAAPLLSGAFALAVSGLGLFTRGCTPLTLVLGMRAGALEGVGDPRMPQVSGVPVLGRVGYGLLTLHCALTLAVADSTAHSERGVIRAAPLVVLGLALAVAAGRLLLPWLRRSGAALAIGVLVSVALWWSAAILTGASPTSLLITALVLATGAACIVGGFRADATALRHYGLTLVMLVVVKLAVLDLADGNSLTQILALLVAGLACFCLSLAYNRFAREQRRGSSPRRDGVT